MRSRGRRGRVSSARPSRGRLQYLQRKGKAKAREVDYEVPHAAGTTRRGRDSGVTMKCPTLHSRGIDCADLSILRRTPQTTRVCATAHVERWARST